MAYEGLRFVIRYGQGGHEHEYTVNIEGFGGAFRDEPDIPQDLIELFARISGCPNWNIMNRGSRLEIYTDFHQDEMDAFLRAFEQMGMIYDPKGDFLW